MAPIPNKNLARKVGWHNGTAFQDVLGLVDAPNVNWGDRQTIDTGDLATAVTAPEPQAGALRGPVIVSFVIKFDKDDTVHAALLADFKAGTERQVQVTRSDATPSTSSWDKALIKSFVEQGGSKDGLALAAVTIAAWGTEAEA